MAPVHVDPAKVREFTDADAFHRWLGENHDRADELWIKIHKKASGLDETSFLQRYTPRGKKSIWSRINVDNVARLTAEGRMTAHGLKQVEAAKADGRWDRAYASVKEMELPADLLAAIAAEPAAQAMLPTLTSQNRFALAFRVHNMKTDAGRRKKITAFVAMLARGETIYPQKTK
ncbi:MAG TPA: YdeI/OmpD-associated family protein [Rhizobiaceae bacterium]|nr:YdeI/OmpD-associated family protein [Rhizobiaceae bacterium]